MASTDSQQSSTPLVKFEASPVESLLSVPGDIYPSLFDNTMDDSSVMDPLEGVLTPASTMENAEETPAPESAGDKKPVKKRKSWGQVLPEPKTNLPPRKRAKTEDEKEQRRVERVLRNRRAAQSSRERKRQEVEALEERCKQLEEALRERNNTVDLLMDEMQRLRGQPGRSSSPLNAYHNQPSPLSLSKPLFGSDGSEQMDDFILMPENNGTVNPASLSPEMTPVPDDMPEVNSTAATSATDAAATPKVTSSDVTQHPAAVLCDLQCQSLEVPQEWSASRQVLPPALSLFLQLQMLLTASSAILSAYRRPLTLIAGALKNNSALPATPSILSTIIWLVTRPPNSPNSTSSNSSATTSAAPPALPQETARSPKSPNPLSASSTLRIRSLRRLLTSSPFLARPLLDATMGLLRLVSEGRDDQIEELADGSPGIKGDRSRGPRTWPDGTSLPSQELLLTLMWAIKVQERQTAQENYHSSPSSRSGSSVFHHKQTPTEYNNVQNMTLKRKRSIKDQGAVQRLRFGSSGVRR
ncbi:uncharacterized protein B0I36DRAFT_335567 [Microdochium trichocladiopsis]|uniref:BZIP domain-containing protein n=1 Tax=Microdochium trichocladiopsis TaxID=1682393 RepID=A0A9P9BK88_9PEZI|nr:uncharacterized protein B0I36DRAFT_335567 [Microdochium trichocladiopsis]KAH7018241.1 hypothetical protein B0I36DRAFT_335567 [Microdochium trichocladiopsis]